MSVWDINIIKLYWICAKKRVKNRAFFYKAEKRDFIIENWKIIWHWKNYLRSYRLFCHFLITRSIFFSFVIKKASIFPYRCSILHFKTTENFIYCTIVLLFSHLFTNISSILKISHSVCVSPKFYQTCLKNNNFKSYTNIIKKIL